jgi:hypothetical protein
MRGGACRTLTADLFAYVGKSMAPPESLTPSSGHTSFDTMTSTVGVICNEASLQLGALCSSDCGIVDLR